MQITKLKIESNPFAKGFRDSSSHESEDPFPGVYNSHQSLPGGMPGLDPFSHIRPPFGSSVPGEDNNNLIAAAEKARMMMMYRAGAPLLPPSLPPPASIPSLPLSPELLARFSASALQANLGLYPPALLAAMVRTSQASPAPLSSPFLSSLPALSPKSPDTAPGKSQRFSPYVLPSSRPSQSPSRFSTLSDGEAGRSPSPRSSPPPVPLYR